ncbi:endolysin [Bifidobacterium primatium]|uniref:Endolysin n=1 Tax=Bifidobacterium primatium TaxID=2045438 RepID=A0A2M9H8M5_9BIFI|nr:CHAP domain-containing protein [Bifidobacterium primatium]PJM73156.1 endolysin [Bifidobacterium primatium]
MATASDVLRIAAGQIGYSRWTDPQQGTKYGRWYAQSHGSYYGANGVPFCAMFASWVLAQAGQSFPGMPAAYVPYILASGRNAGRAVNIRSARPGDLVIFNWDGGVVDHIGFVEVNRGSYLQTIEGNTNNGRVARRTRAWGVVAAILRPAYGTPSTSGALAVDGVWGRATTARLQKVLGTPVDGEIWHQWWPNRQAAFGSGWQYDATGDGSPVIRRMQQKLGVKADGIIGRNTIDALQRHYGSSVDHFLGASSWTVKRMQEALNKCRF